MPAPFRYCDLHTHFLPGIDDGCLDLEESRECLAAVHQAGCRHVVCTPHMGVDRYPANTPAYVEQRLGELRDLATDHRLDLQIHGGGEFRLNHNSIDWWQTHGVPTLGNSSVVLVDTWDTDWPAAFDDALDWLVQQGYQPMLAHPERMRFQDGLWQHVIDRLLEQGHWLQGNLKSFGEFEQPEVQRRGKWLLSHDHYQVLASDSHGPHSLQARWSGLQWLSESLSESRLNQLLWHQPLEILMAEDGKPERS